ncbi:MAG: hypothetical protein ACYDBI_05795 [Thermoplasmataceae archaeon]
MTYVFANNVTTTIATALTSTGTSVTLSSSANLPTLAAGDILPVTLAPVTAGTQSPEIVYATAISGATLTIERGQEGTTGQAWAVGSLAYSTNTAGTTGSQGGDSSISFAADNLTVAGTLDVSGNATITALNVAVDSGTANAYVLTTTPALPTLSSTVGVGTKLTFLPLNTNTGASTANAVAIVGPAGALQGGEIVAAKPTTVTWTGTEWVLEPGSGATQTSPATASNQAVQYAQITQKISGTVQNPPTGSGFAYSATSLTVTTGGFTAPCNGLLIAFSLTSCSGNNSNGLTFTANPTDFTTKSSESLGSNSFGFGILPMTAGQVNSELYSDATCVAAATLTTVIGSIFIPTP